MPYLDSWRGGSMYGKHFYIIMICILVFNSTVQLEDYCDAPTTLTTKVNPGTKERQTEVNVCLMVESLKRGGGVENPRTNQKNRKNKN